MQTVGKLLKDARTKKKLSISRLSRETKIKEKFLRAIEEEDWHALPSFAATAGFVRSVSLAIKIDPQRALALLRRDFQQKEVLPKKTRHITWTPRLTATVVSLFGILLLFGYLGSQYLAYQTPPPLEVETKREGNQVVITGKTNKEAQMLLNNEPILVGDDGAFKVTIKAEQGTVLTLESRSRSGKSTKKELSAP